MNSRDRCVCWGWDAEGVDKKTHTLQADNLSDSPFPGTGQDERNEDNREAAFLGTHSLEQIGWIMKMGATRVRRRKGISQRAKEEDAHTAVADTEGPEWQRARIQPVPGRAAEKGRGSPGAERLIRAATRAHCAATSFCPCSLPRAGELTPTLHTPQAVSSYARVEPGHLTPNPSLPPLRRIYPEPLPS